MTGTAEFCVRVDVAETGTTLTAVGDIDMLSGAEFTTALREAVLGARRDLRIDLSGVTYFGSEGVQALVAAERLAVDQGVQMSTTASRIVARALEATALSDLLER